jgi:hypothetical protein
MTPMTRRILIISPHFPPTNAPDHQRVRMALPYLAEFGWQATVLGVRAEDVDTVTDPVLVQTLPKEVQVVRVGAWSSRWARKIGVGGLTYRAWGTMRRAGDELLRREKFDLVFFSTTQCAFMSLGPRWLKKFGVPYALDFHDPWWSDYYYRHPEQRPPGGKLKFAISNWLAARQEPPTVRGAAQIVSVSATYPTVFKERYPDLSLEKFTTLPFGAPETDFYFIRGGGVNQSWFDPKDGREHWVYVGRCGQDMRYAVRAFLIALRRHLEKHPDQRDKLRVHFLGTDYAPRALARKNAEPIARELGLADVFDEQTDRIPYFEALRCVSDATTLIMPGSDDPGYTASKIYPCILARKPMLAIFHETSSVVDVLRSTRAGTAVTFPTGRPVEALADDISREWFDKLPQPTPQTDWAAFAPFTAKAMTKKLCEVFDRAVAK